MAKTAVEFAETVSGCPETDDSYARLRSHDRPTVITVVDTASEIQPAVDAVADLIENGLMVTSGVEIIKYAHRPSATTAIAG